jgi:hypothetical protein
MSTEDIKRKLTTIFSADVEGYSRLMGDMSLQISLRPQPAEKTLDTPSLWDEYEVYIERYFTL